MVKLNLSSLVHAKVGQRQVVVLDSGPLVLRDLHLTHIAGELQLTRVSGGILAVGTLDTALEAECTRCLEPFFEPVSIKLEDVISLPGADLTPECPARASEDGWVDLDPLIHDYVWLNIPMNPLCSPDCRGICSQCGGNLNRGECTCGDSAQIDPRWEALRTLLDENT